MARTVLIVEPSEAALGKIMDILTGLGLGAHIAASGADVLSFQHQNAPDIVIVPDHLSDMDLEQFIGAVRKRYRTAEMIVLSHTQPVSALEARLKGCGVAGWPTQPRELELLLRIAEERIVSGRRLRNEKRDIARKAKHRFDRRMDTERFLTVKQVVDKVSSFIGDMAREVEGGVRYFNEIPYFIAIHDRRYRVTAANRAYRVLLGRRMGDPSWEVYDGAAGSHEACPVGRTFQTENALELRETLRYRSGAKVPVIVHTAPIYNNRGEVEMVLEVSAGTRDIHQLKKDLHTTQQRYQLLFDAVPCHVAVLDRDMRFTATNRHFIEAFGDQTGAAFLDVFSSGKEDLSGTPIFETYQDGQSHHGEMTLISADWHRLEALVWTSPMMSPAGKLLQVLLIFLDITQIRDLQNNLSFLGLMIASISHSIKGVLSGLDAGVYTLEHAIADCDEAQIREGLDLVKHMAERIQKITLDILFYAKERELNRASVDIQAFAKDLAETVLPRFERWGIALATDIAPCDGSFFVDAGLLKAALVNIVENALDACVADQRAGRHHRVDLTLACTPEALTVIVADNGIGMSQGQIEKLFTVFYSTKGIRGTGLGLFIADTIIHQHGGDIAVESTPGQGSRFCIKLPRNHPKTAS